MGGRGPPGRGMFGIAVGMSSGALLMVAEVTDLGVLQCLAVSALCRLLFIEAKKLGWLGQQPTDHSISLSPILSETEAASGIAGMRGGAEGMPPARWTLEHATCAWGQRSDALRAKSGALQALPANRTGGFALHAACHDMPCLLRGIFFCSIISYSMICYIKLYTADLHS